MRRKQRHIFRHHGRDHANADEEHRQDANGHHPMQHALNHGEMSDGNRSWLGVRCRSRIILGFRRAPIERLRISGRSSRGERIVGYLYAVRQDGRIEIDVAARTVGLGLDLLHDERAGIDRSAAFRPRLAWVRGRIPGLATVNIIVQRCGPPTTRRRFPAPENPGRAWQDHPRDRYGFAAGSSDQRTACSAPEPSVKIKR